MFSSIHFLFLSSLGIFSWAILCYFYQIEKYLTKSRNSEGDYQMHLNMEGKPQESSPIDQPENGDLYINFLCVFVCMYALAKVVDMAENCMAKEMYDKLNITRGFPVLNKKCDLIPPEIQHNNSMLSKIMKLEQENQLLKYELHKSNIRNAQQSMDHQQNICISKRQFSWNQNVYLSKGDDDICNSRNLQNSDIGNTIWSKYLELRKKSLQNEFETFMPVVMSAQDLDNIDIKSMTAGNVGK
ncbi:uncharacterized protein LOC106096147 [Stomoxys calcitrans]|uniref:uncharacterized protein LOC106096147 n=1 Tax=Stomoxys calcitrans TaxID=35570 RepID=UPI0027E2B203|nr:uncharacterized protein LOC106096147 [Stomoxys calcitrans]